MWVSISNYLSTNMRIFGIVCSSECQESWMCADAGIVTLYWSFVFEASFRFSWQRPFCGHVSKTFFLEAEFWEEIQTKVLRLRVFLLVIHNHLYSLVWRFLFLQTPTTSYSFFKGEKPGRKPYYGLRNPYRNLKPENSQDYAQKPQWNCTFMNPAFVLLYENAPPSSLRT